MSGGLGGKSTGQREFTRDMRNEARRLSPDEKARRKAVRVEAKRANEVQRIYELAEQARRAIWESDDPNDASEPLDSLIAAALKLGAKEIDRDYNDEDPPQSWVQS